MQQTPARTNLFTDTAIPRKIYLEHNVDGIPAVKELTGAALDDATVDILNSPAANACLVVKFYPDDQANAPLIFEYFIKRFLMTDHHQYERAIEVRLEPWLKTRPAVQHRSAQPIKVFSHGYITVFARITVRLVTIHAGKKASYEISSNAKLDQLTGIITL